MNKFFLAAAALAGTLVATAPAQAQYRNNGHRDAQQEHGIHQGWRQGQLSPREYAHLEREQARTDRYRYRSRHDNGHLSWREHQRLAAMRAYASRDIHREPYDRQGWYR